MREIKFRGKRLDNGEWVYGYYSLVRFRDGDTSRISTIFGRTSLVDPATIGQYTGLKDKNGVEIYEGDVILYYNYKQELVEVDPDNIDPTRRVYHEETETGYKYLAQYQETGKILRYKGTSPVSIDPIFGVNIHLPHRHAWYNHEDNGTLLRCECIGNIYDNPKLLEANR